MARRKLPVVVVGRIALYVRLSKADLSAFTGTDEERWSKGIGRQRDDGLELARRRYDLPRRAAVRRHTDPDAHTADVVIYVEDGESAWKKRQVWIVDQYGERRRAWRNVRPVWGVMMRDIRAQQYGLVIIYNSDRLARDVYDSEDVIETAERHGVRWDAASGAFDLSTEDGRTMARMMAVMNQRASADTSRRQKRKHQELAENGQTSGGPRPFGWNDDRRTLNPAEARELRKAVRAIRAGIKPTEILKEWHERGVVTSKGNTWQQAPFMLMLRNPRLCGYRGRVVAKTRETGAEVRAWEIVKLADGTEVKGVWKPLIGRDEWEDLQARIGTESRPKGEYDPEAGNGGGKYLLSGMVHCGRCGGKMNGNTRTWKTADGISTATQFLCPIKRQGGCASNGRAMAPVDELIEAFVLRLHAEGAADQDQENDSSDYDAEIARLDELVRDAYAEWKRPGSELTSAAYFAIRRDLERERAAVEAERAKVVRSQSSSVLDEIARRWPTATLAERRAFVRAYLSAVVIHPVAPVWDESKGRMVHPTRFNPALIEPVPVTRQRGPVGAVS